MDLIVGNVCDLTLNMICLFFKLEVVFDDLMVVYVVVFDFV